jgi:hypothetical protein
MLLNICIIKLNLVSIFYHFYNNNYHNNIRKFKKNRNLTSFSLTKINRIIKKNFSILISLKMIINKNKLKKKSIFFFQNYLISMLKTILNNITTQ